MFYRSFVYPIAGIFFRFLQFIISPFLYLWMPNGSGVPKTRDPILNLSIKEITQKLKAQELTCENLVKTFIDRVHSVNPAVNAVVQDRFDDAIKEAQEIDKLIRNNDDKIHQMPLLGVPFSVKQIISVKGLTSVNGSLHQPKDIIYDEDAEVITQIRNAGGIPILLSNTPEISCGFETYNHVKGITRNPYNLARSAGGSSGGEGALIACNASVFGLGTDTAGSIRLPAHWNGICGHKPTPGLVSMKGIYPVFPLEPLTMKHNVCGPLARNVSDLKAILDVIIGENKLEDPSAKDIKVLYATQLAPRFMMGKVDSYYQSLIEKVVYNLSQDFEVEPFDTKRFYRLPECVTYHMTISCKYPYLLQTKPKYLKGTPKLKERLPRLWKEILKITFCLSNFTYNLIYWECLKRWRGLLLDWKNWVKPAIKMEEDFVKMLSNDTVLILPTYPTAALPHGSTFLRPIDSTYMALCNAFGLPSTQIPIGFTKDGLPLGLQVIGGPNQDKLTLKVAQDIENIVKMGFVLENKSNLK